MGTILIGILSSIFYLLSSIYHPMSGHSKWKQIKYKKGAADVKRGKIFSSLTKAITVASRTGQNLDMAVSRAKTANMPANNIERAIKKGTGELNDGTTIEELVYECYGPGGAAILISALTDNRNRTLAELKSTLNKLGGRLAETGSVQYLFDRQGLIEVALNPNRARDDVELMLIEAGVDDIQAEDDRLSIIVSPSALMLTKKAIEQNGLSVLDTHLTNVAKMTITLSSDDEQKLIRLMEAIDELDDVESIETNAELL